MNKYFPIILLLFFISCNYKFIDKPGLKGKVKKYTEYKLLVDNEVENDTFSIMTSIYNRKGQIVNQFIKLKNGELFNQDFEYDNEEKLIKEISYYNNNKIVVKYEYNDSLLMRAFSESKTDSLVTIMNEEYYYNDRNRLDWSNYSQIIISEGDSTIFTRKCYYNNNEKLNESITQWNSVFDSTFNKTKFEYNDFGLFSKSFDYNQSDSLIRIDDYKYEYDYNGSWIKKETFRNDTLKYLYIRKIEYQ